MPGNANNAVAKLHELRRSFHGPSVELRPVIFWLWNGRLTRERLAAQLDDIAAHGFGGVVIHPMGEEFRLVDFIAGISPPYLSDEFFEMVRFAVERAAAVGLKVWLYDEGGWPSGTAQGKVVAGRPELCAKVVRPRRGRPEDVGAEGVVAVLAASEGGLRVLESAEEVRQGERLVTFEVRAVEGTYPDLMDPEAVRRFIELTHERYAEAVGEFFGTVIPGIFTDEPALRGTIGGAEAPWSPALRQRLEASGEQWQLWLPALFDGDVLGFDPFEVLGRAEAIAARCRYAEAVSAQFREAYWEQLNRWCEEHGLLHTGHVGGEDNLHDHVAGGFWHWFRTAGTLHVPGVDVIWRQLYPGRANFSFPQLASSAVHIRGRSEAGGDLNGPACVSESFAVYGFGTTFAELAWVAGFQMVRGVDGIWPMYYAYDVADGKCYGTVAHWGPGNPMWRRWEAFADYLARLAIAVRAGNHAADVAVYYPIEAEWAYHGWPEAKKAWESWRDICELLHANQVAFDIIDADAICAAKLDDGALDVGGQWYSTVVVPDCAVLPTAVLQRLWEFHKAGGRVVFLGQVPADSAEGTTAEHRELVRKFEARAFTLDERAEREQWGTAGGAATAAATPSVFDGMTSAFMGPVPTDVFAPAAMKRDAIVVAPEDERARAARLLALVVGRYGAVAVEQEQAVELRSLAAWLGEDVWLQVVFNEGTGPLSARLAAVGERPFAVERWDPATGAQQVVAVCEDVTAPTEFTLELAAGEAAVLILRPREPGDRVAPVGRKRRLVLYEADAADEAIVVEECVIDHGTLRTSTERRPLPAPDLRGWDEFAETEYLAGTVAYVFRIPLAADYVNEELWLEIEDARHAVEVYVNGQRAGARLWPPYAVEVSGMMREGENEVVVEVTNTLAPQVVRPENIAEAKDKGWDNVYYRRAFEWVEEGLGGGLVGALRLVCHSRK